MRKKNILKFGFATIVVIFAVFVKTPSQAFGACYEITDQACEVSALTNFCADQAKAPIVTYSVTPPATWSSPPNCNNYPTNACPSDVVTYTSVPDSNCLTGNTGPFIQITSATVAGTQLNVTGIAAGQSAQLFDKPCLNPNPIPYPIVVGRASPTGYSIDSGANQPYGFLVTAIGKNQNCGNVNPSQDWNYSFSISTSISSLTSGTHSIKVCSAYDAVDIVSGGTMCDTAPFTTAGTSGTINVSSTNYANGQLVPSTWDVSGLANYHSANVSTATYGGVPISGPTPYVITPTTGSAGTLYALRGVEERHIAGADPTLFGKLLAFSKDLIFGVANAEQSCGAVNRLVNTTTDCVLGASFGVTLQNTGDFANFIILWDPIGTISATPAISFVAPTLSGPIALTNNGAPGSTVTNLTAAVSYISGPSNWLTVGSLSGITLTQGAGPTNVTLTANPPGSACDGGCTARIVFAGDSANLPPGNVHSNLVTVTVTTSVGGGGNPSVVIVSPTPAAAGVPVKVDCQGGSAPYTWSGTGSPFFSNKSADGSSIYVQYDVPNTYTLTCTDKNGLSDSAPIVITPDCTLTASPTKVVPPQQSVLSWSCVPGTAVSNSCSLAGSSGLPTAGTMNVAPAQTTSYTLSCDANNAIPGSKIPPTQVIVTTQGPGVIETNP